MLISPFFVSWEDPDTMDGVFQQRGFVVACCAILQQVHIASLMGQVGSNNWFIRILLYFCSKQAADLLWAPTAFCLVVLSWDLRLFSPWHHVKQACMCRVLVKCVRFCGMERQTAEGTSRRMGHFPCYFCPLFPCSLSSWTQVQSRSEQVMLCSHLRKPKQISALCCLREWKMFHVLQNPSALLEPRSTGSLVCPWLVQSVHPKICLCWSQRRNQSACPVDCPDFSLLQLIFIFLFVKENISKVHQLVRSQKCMQLVQMKTLNWGKDRLWSPVFQFNHLKSTAWNTRCFRKRYTI